MGKLTTYIMIMSGLMIMFYFGGLISDCTNDGLCESTTPNSLLLDHLMHPENIKSSTLATKITTAIALIGVGAAIILGFANRNIELAVTGAVATYLFTLLLDFIAVFNRLRAIRPELAIIIFAPTLLLYCVTIIEWWRGQD